MSFELKVRLWILQALIEQKRNSTRPASEAPKAQSDRPAQAA